MDQDSEYRLVYDGIQAVASRCDGARSQDGVGFNGQDTHFGRRIAALSYDEWTAEIRQEAARIALTYKAQIESYTGTDVATLDVVRVANDLGTNHTAREQARKSEQARENQGLKAERSAKLLVANDERKTLNGIALSWHSKDPDCFGVLLNEVKKLPGRSWTGTVNKVALSIEACDFIERHGIVADFDVDKLRAKLEEQAAAPVKSEPTIGRAAQVTLQGERVRLVTPYDQSLVTAIRSLPGRHYEGGSINTADVTAKVLDLAKEFNLTVADDVVAAVQALQAGQEAIESAESVLLAASKASSPDELPEAFVAQVLAVLA